MTVTANDPDGLSATQSFAVTVMSGFRDDFDSSSSLSLWELSQYIEAEVTDGTLRLNQTSSDFIGYATHALGVPLDSDWEASARMGTEDGGAWPSLWILTGDARFEVYRLDIGLVVPLGEDTVNYLFAVWDGNAGGWFYMYDDEDEDDRPIRGTTPAINTGDGEFTDIALSFAGGRFRARAGSAQLFEGKLIEGMPTRIDSVALAILWGGAGDAVLFDWVAVDALDGFGVASDRAAPSSDLRTAPRKRFGGRDGSTVIRLFSRRAAGQQAGTGLSGWTHYREDELSPAPGSKPKIRFRPSGEGPP